MNPYDSKNDLPALEDIDLGGNLIAYQGRALAGLFWMEGDTQANVFAFLEDDEVQVATVYVQAESAQYTLHPTLGSGHDLPVMEGMARKQDKARQVPTTSRALQEIGRLVAIERSLRRPPSQEPQGEKPEGSAVSPIPEKTGAEDLPSSLPRYGGLEARREAVSA